MIAALRSTLTLLLVFAINSLFAQAPNISYNSTPQYFTATVPIPGYSPTNTGGVVPDGSSAVVIASGMNNPRGLAIDAAGNIFIAGNSSNNVLELPAGSHSFTIIDSGVIQPGAVAVDNAHNVYVTDYGNAVVKKIPAGGGANVIVGSGFTHPYGLAIDAAGNLYASDLTQGVVKKISAIDGSTVNIGTGFNTPCGVAVDAAGNVFVCDRGNNQIVKIPAGGGSQVTVATGLAGPTDIAVDGVGNLFIANSFAGSIVKVPAGTNNIVVISTGAPDSFNTPAGVTVDAMGNIYVSDSGNGAIKEISGGGFSIRPGLPAGLFINQSSGLISGTPAAPSPATTYTITATNSSGSSTATVTFSVLPFTAPSISYSSPHLYTAGTAISPLTPANAGGPVQVQAPYPVYYVYADPRGVAADAAGNLYVADYGNDRVQKITPNGQVQFIPGLNAFEPSGVAVDAAGNVYVADFGNNLVKKVPAGGGAVVNIGSGIAMPYGIAVDAAGNVYVSSQLNNTVYKINASDGSTIAIATGFSNPGGLAVDAAGNVYVADTNNNQVKKITAGSGIVTVMNGTFNLPNGVAVDGFGNLFVTNSNSATATELPAGGSSQIAVGSGFSMPQGIAVDAHGNLYVTDNGSRTLMAINAGGFTIDKDLPKGLNFNTATGVISGTPTTASPAANYTVRAINVAGSSTATVNIGVQALPLPSLSYQSPVVFGTGSPVVLKPTSSNVGLVSSGITTKVSGLGDVRGISVDDTGNVYIADINKSYITKVVAGTNNTMTLGSGFNAPTGAVVDAATGNIYVADYLNNVVKKIAAGNGAIVTVGSGFNGPYGIAVDAAGNVYVGDANNNAVKKIPAGSNTPVNIGTGFNHPTGVAVDAAGNVYVADRGDNAIKEIVKSSGNTITLATASGNPNGVAVDKSGNVYFADNNNSSVMELPAGGGGPTPVGSAFSQPTAVAAFNSNDIFVADNGNNAIREVKITGGFFITPLLPAGLTLDVATGTISGTPSVATPATNYTVKAFNNTGSSSAIVNIRTLAADTGLVNLAVSSGALSPVFNGSTASYNVAEPNNISAVTVTPTTASANFTVTVNGAAVASGTPSAAIPLTVGTNTINVVIKDQTAAVTGGYILNLTRAASTNALLTKITTNSGTALTSVAGPGYKNFTTTVPFATNSIVITPVAQDGTSSIMVNGNPVISGAASQLIPLSPGANSIVTTVTAQDGTTAESYIITVNRSAPAIIAALNALTVSNGTLSPAFATNTHAYTVTEANAITSITLKPTVSDATARVTVNGKAVVSGTASTPVTLSVGQNIIQTIVTAQDGATTSTYTTTVTRAPSADATLSSLIINTAALSPAFSAVTTSYTASVPNSVTLISIKPQATNIGATVKVNGTTVARDSTSGALPLAVGVNNFSVVVTAQDGTTIKTYAIAITRASAGSSNALLTKLTTNSGVPLTQVTGPDYKDYAITVPNTLTSITVTPTTQDATATVKVNGVTVASGTASPAMPLAAGANVINTVVTAQDGVTVKTYSIAVTRTGSSNAALTNLVTNDGAITPVFSTGTTSYALSVPNATTSVILTPTAADTTATIKINGIIVASKASSPAIPLAAGQNIINTVVTAQDGTTTKAYTVTVTRAPSTNALLASIKTLPAETLTATTGAGYRNYTATVPSSQSTIQVIATAQDPTATITVNGATVASGAASAAIPLAVGTNVITTTATAQDGVTTKSYIITITRPSNNALLTKIATNSGVALTSTTGPDYKDYTINVPNATSSITVTPTTQDATATVKVNGVTVASGTASAAIPLQVGANTITTVVTAQDGTTTKTYGITANRAAMFSLYKPTDSLAADGLTVHPGITPNGDGINDIFTIDGIGTYPDNKVTIMNRSGAVIFEAKGYDNQTKFFDGHSNKTGALQLAGTYFYSLEYSSNGKTKIKTGFVVLKY